MTLFMNQLLDSKLTDHVVEKEKSYEPEEAPEETTMVMWDCMSTLGLDEEEPTEEVQLSEVNVTTGSKGPIVDEILLLPNIRKIRERMKKISSNTETPPIPDFFITRKRAPVVSKPVRL